MEWDLGMFRAANRRSFVRATHRLRDSAISGFDRFSLSLFLVHLVPRPLDALFSS